MVSDISTPQENFSNLFCHPLTCVVHEAAARRGQILYESGKYEHRAPPLFAPINAFHSNLGPTTSLWPTQVIDRLIIGCAINASS